MTLPPETYPLRGFERGGQINWRRTALRDTRIALRKAELLRRVRRSPDVRAVVKQPDGVCPWSWRTGRRHAGAQRTSL